MKRIIDEDMKRIGSPRYQRPRVIRSTMRHTGRSFVVMALLALMSCGTRPSADASPRLVRYYDKPLGVSYEVPSDFGIKGSGPIEGDAHILSTPTQLSSPSRNTRIELQLVRATSDDLHAVAAQWMAAGRDATGTDIRVATHPAYRTEGVLQKDGEGVVVLVLARAGQVLVVQLLPRTSPRARDFEHLLDSLSIDT